MKKKIFLVLGLIVFAILAAGSVGGNTEAGKGNVNVAESDASPAAADHSGATRSGPSRAAVAASIWQGEGVATGGRTA